MTSNIIQRSFSLLAAALITLCATAAGKVEVTGNTSYGTVTSQVNGVVATITVTPTSGYYIRKSDITATRTFMPTAEARRRGIPVADQLTLVGNDPDDLSQARTYTITLPGEEYDILLDVSYQEQTTITESMVTLSETVFVYNQQVQHPTVLVSGLTEGRDFTLSYSDDQATEPGTYTLTVNGRSMWKGSVSRSYKIFKGGKAEVNTSIQGGIIATAVDGLTVTLTVTPADGYYVRKQDIQVAKTFMPVAANSQRAIPVADLLTLEGDDPSDLSVARTYTAQLPGWEYSAYVDATFTQRSTVTSDMVSLSPTTFIYNGQDQKPAVTVRGLTEGVDYLVHFEGTSWADVATYKVSVTGRSTWKGTVSKTWTITKAPAEVTQVPQALALTYNGQPQVLAEVGDCIGGTMLYSLDGLTFDTTMPTGTTAGNYTLYYMVQGDANHSDTQTQSISVTIAKAMVTVSGITAQDKVYDGTTDVVLVLNQAVFEGMVQGDALTVSAEGAFADAQAGTDKVVSISNLVLDGQSVSNYLLAETGNQTETRAAITPKDIATASLSEIPAQTFTGAPLTPEVTVTLDGVELNADSDYTIDYADNVNVGTATITITGTGNYQGNAQTTFAIMAGSIENATVADIPAQTYNGQPLTPAVTVLLDGVELNPEIDYTVAYTDNMNVGTATITITGTGNYQGSVLKTFTVSPMTVTVSGITAQDKVYDGTTDVVLVFDNVVFEGMAEGDALTVSAEGAFVDAQAGTDKVVSISNPVLGGQSVSNYLLAETGNQTETLATITPKDIATASLSEVPAQTFTGAPLTPEIAVTLDGVELNAESDYTIDYADNVNVGTATITITGKGNYQGSTQTYFDITAESIEEAVLTTASVQVYTGEPIEPKVTVTLDDVKLEAGTDFTVAYANNTEAGTATITVTGAGNYTGSKETTFIIDKPQPMVDENEQKVEAIVVENEEGEKEAVLTELPENFWESETPSEIPGTVTDGDGNSYNVTEVAPQAFTDMPSGTIYELPENVSTTEGVTNVINGDGTCETLDLTDVSGYDVSKDVEVEEVVYTREVSSDEEAFTVCMPYDCEIPEGYEAYTFETVDGQIMFNRYVGILQAYQPYLLKRVSSPASARRRAGETTIELSAKNVTITPQAGQSVLHDDYELCGTVHSLTHGQANEMGIYTLQPDMTWMQSYSSRPDDADKTFLKPFQAYMLYKGYEEMPSLSFDTKEDISTPIREVSGQRTTAADTIYNLQGQKVSNGQISKGLYIVNGRKVVMK